MGDAMDKNILEKLLAEYDQNIDGILKKYGEKEGLGKIAGSFTFRSCTESLGSSLKQ
jgi:NAD-dependent SIR2 family protein deacetylase